MIRRFTSILILFAPIGAFLFLLVAYTKVSAQIPDPVPFPCGRESFSNPVGNPEFNTYRPYQSSPCNPNVQDVALFCGNDVVLQDQVEGRYDPFGLYGGSTGDCTDIGGGKVRCDFIDQKTKSVSIDLSNATLPILGNTDDSKNAFGDGTLDSATKLNEYVSWYLNGTNSNPTETGPQEEDTLAGNIINFSGPLRKLLPNRIMRDIISGSGDPNGEHAEGTAQDAIAGTRHNQVIGCTNTAGEIVPCEELNLAGVVVRPSYFGDINPPPKEEDYDSFNEWYLEYRKWKGDICVDFGVGNICIDNPFSFRHIFDLYYTIPFSSTEDRKGDVKVETFNIQPYQKDVTITNVTNNISPAELSFSHTEEAVKLGRELQTTFAPKGQIDNQPITNVSDPPDYAGCVVAEVRSNPGDDLFAGGLTGDVNYTAEYSCEFDKIEEPPITPPEPGSYCQLQGGSCFDNQWISKSCRNTWGGGITVGCSQGTFCADRCKDFEYEEQLCQKTVQINLSLITETPQADEMFERLVGGSSSVFKRIFPWIGVGGSTTTSGPIAAIVDIPGATSVTYSGDGVVNGKPELYFPHIGSLHEYLLECTQTALRPKGYGAVCESGTPSNAPPGGGTCPVVSDSEIPSLWTGAIKSQFINNLAVNWPTKSECKNLESTLADECYNYVVKRSIDAGINPAFSLAIWINESQASNYCQGGATSQDFGIKIPSLYQNFEGQLDFFLGLPFSSTYLSCKNQAGWSEPMKAFLSRFQAGGCDPNSSLGNAYFDNIKNGAWYFVTSPVTDCRGNGGTSFGLSWPNDKSCP